MNGHSNRYKPRPNEVATESSLTVLKIELPTGVEAYLEDLRQVGCSSDLVAVFPFSSLNLMLCKVQGLRRADDLPL